MCFLLWGGGWIIHGLAVSSVAPLSVPTPTRAIFPPCSPEDNLLTPSMKLKRPQLKEKYQSNIKKMYDELRKASN